jgi:hypothetical protein
MQQDLHTIQGPVRLLAESTGGRAINKGGDLKVTLDAIDQDSTSLYELGFEPDTPADGKFHTLLVKVPGRKDVKLRYRNGYLYNDEPTSTQERFQQAVWNPQDLTGLRLNLHVISQLLPSDKGKPGESILKLNIGVPGLALRQKDDRWTGQVYVFLAEREDATQKAQVSGEALHLSLKKDTYDEKKQAGVSYERAVEVRSSLGSIRVIVVDANSGAMGSVTVPSSAL